MADSIELIKLDFDELAEEAEREGRVGICPICELAAEEDGIPPNPRLLCFCGVCLKYHHNDYFHEMMDETEGP